MVTVSVKALTVSPPLTADKKVTVNYQLNLDRLAYEAVKAKEQEHLDDFQAAFTMTGQEVANRINKLTGVYKTPELALKALLEGLDKKLVPKFPLELESWTPRLRQVAIELADLSVERDTKFEHTPEGYDCTVTLSTGSNTLEFKPRMKAVATPTLNLIRFDKLGPAVWDGEAMSPPDVGGFTKGSMVRVKSTATGIAVRPSMDKDWDIGPSHDPISPGLECRVEEVEKDGIWVSVTREQLKAAGVWRRFEDYFTFEPLTDLLWFKLPASSF
jgi:hypothetical protein